MEPIEQIIDERCDAEEAISQAYYLVTGKSPEWSNIFGHNEALEEIGAAVHLLKREAKASSTAKTKLRKWASGETDDMPNGLQCMPFPAMATLARWLETISK